MSFRAAILIGEAKNRVLSLSLPILLLLQQRVAATKSRAICRVAETVFSRFGLTLDSLFPSFPVYSTFYVFSKFAVSQRGSLRTPHLGAAG